MPAGGTKRTRVSALLSELDGARITIGHRHDLPDCAADGIALGRFAKVRRLVDVCRCVGGDSSFGLGVARPTRLLSPMVMDASWSTPTPPPSLQIEERDDVDGVLRVILLGEVDIAVAGYLSTHLARLIRSRPRVRLDLSQLWFIDLSGMRALVSTLHAARGEGRDIEVGPTICASVERIVVLSGAASVLWPEDGGPGGRIRLRLIKP